MFGFIMFSVNGGACSRYSTRSDFCEQRVARQQHRAALPMKRAVMKYVEADKAHKKKNEHAVDLFHRMSQKCEQ